ncbi:MAG: hypothetical protein KGM98_02525 [Bacteroidota bacterium]|nr:hypothetical protein [Bacteroidota bacterium]
MDQSVIITGDITHFTQLGDQDRQDIIRETEALIQSWVPQPGWAEIFRGDSYQLRLEEMSVALLKAVQLICWFKKRPPYPGGVELGGRLSLGIGAVAYTGKTVLDSDGEAFHLSGRNFDTMETEEFLRITTPDPALNSQIAILLSFINILIGQWTSGQAEVIYLAIEGYTQTRMAEVLGIQQSAVHNRLKISNWKAVKAGLEYIIELTRNKSSK